MRSHLRNWYTKFWVWLYLLAGRKVGPEVDAYWDRHWRKVVAIHLAELWQSDMGKQMVTFLVSDRYVDPDRQGREFRMAEREVRHGNR